MNIYCFSTLSFAKLQFKSVINKAFHKHGVASFTDAWIETYLKSKEYETVRSHLLQMRGLKHDNKKSHQWSNRCRIFYRCVDWNGAYAGDAAYGRVASFTDAWIETVLLQDYRYYCQSHLLQMRGLKQVIRGNVDSILVASFTDGWIETTNTTNVRPKRMSHLLQMRGLKHFDCTAQLPISRSHLLQMRGLKPITNLSPWLLNMSRIFYRCVDWNITLIFNRSRRCVASFTDAWIETYKEIIEGRFDVSRIFYSCVDWNIPSDI